VGVERDPAKAKAFFEEAALKGSAVGAQKLAGLLADGEPGPADPAGAAYWAARAVALGNAGAAPLADGLRAGLSAAQRSELERRLSEAAKTPPPVAVPR
jgi:TPR repeat protein